MPADQDRSSGDRDQAAYLPTMARQELAEVQSADALTVAAVVKHALIELFDDAASGYVTLAGVPVAIRQGLEDERLITPPQTALVGLDGEQEPQQHALYRRYVRLIERRVPDQEEGFAAHSIQT
jgi:hypothetical protein